MCRSKIQSKNIQWSGWGSLAIVLSWSLSAQAFDENDLTKLRVTRSCQRCDLEQVDLGVANLTGVLLINASLNGANLRVADLSQANLQGADLQEADLTGAILEGANLWNSTLTKTRLKQAIYDRFTKFPDNFDPTVFGMKMLKEQLE